MHAYLWAGILAAPARIKGLAPRIVQRCGGRAGGEAPSPWNRNLQHPRVDRHSHTSGEGKTALYLSGNSSAIWHFQANRILLIKISYFFLVAKMHDLSTQPLSAYTHLSDELNPTEIIALVFFNPEFFWNATTSVIHFTKFSCHHSSWACNLFQI